MYCTLLFFHGILDADAVQSYLLVKLPSTHSIRNESDCL